jgi:hypothetical protein
VVGVGVVGIESDGLIVIGNGSVILLPFAPDSAVCKCNRHIRKQILSDKSERRLR